MSLVVLSSWSLLDKTEGAFISISVTTKGAMQKGYGIEMTVMNIETKRLYQSNSLGQISPHSIIENLPAGKYIVSKIEIPLGSLKYINQSQDLMDFFGVLEFEEGKAYYLGDFHGVRKVGRQNVFHLKIQNQNIPEKLIKKLKKKGMDLKEQNFIKTYPYLKDELVVY